MANTNKNGLKEALRDDSIKFWIDVRDENGNHYSIDRLLTNLQMRTLLKEIDKDERFANSPIIVYWTTCYFAEDVWNDIVSHSPSFSHALIELDKRMPWSWFSKYWRNKHYI